MRHKNLIIMLCLLALGATLGGCTKCGWLFSDGSRACHSDAPPR